MTSQVKRARRLLILVLAGLASPAAAAEPGSEGLAFFEAEVRPLLVEHCYGCHSGGAKKVRGGLLLDTKAGWAKGGDSGPAIAPGDPEESLLVQAVRYDEPDLKMPPDGKLPDRAIAALTDWVKRGAPDPRTGPSVPPARKTVDVEAGRRFWAFQPLRSPEPPEVRDAAWCRTPADRFILAEL